MQWFLFPLVCLALFGPVLLGIACWQHMRSGYYAEGVLDFFATFMSLGFLVCVLLKVLE